MDTVAAPVGDLYRGGMLCNEPGSHFLVDGATWKTDRGAEFSDFQRLETGAVKASRELNLWQNNDWSLFISGLSAGKTLHFWKDCEDQGQPS